MPKNRSFNTKITIYPELFKSDDFDYIRDVINTWIEENYIAHTDNFVVSVEQVSGIAQFYNYDKTESAEDLDTSQLWRNTGGRYNIFVSGEGKVLNSSIEKVFPPTTLIDFAIKLLDFRYMVVQDQEIHALTFGQTIGFPREYSSSNADAEDWLSKFQGENNVYTHDMSIEFSCSEETMQQVRPILEELKSLSLSKQGLGIQIDDEEVRLGYSDFGCIKINGNFVLKTENKSNFIKCLNNLGRLFINDDFCSVEKINILMTACNNKTLYAEYYYYDELSGKFKIKSILL